MACSVPGHGGATWAALQYVLGLRALGCDVLLLDEVRGPGDPAARERCLAELVAAFGLEGRAALLTGGGRALGFDYADVLAFAASADLLINLAGTVRDPRVLEAAPRRLLVDLDPAFTQLWHAQGVDVGIAAHDRFASVGLRLHAPECDVPDGGVRWEPTLPPVALEHWPVATEAPREGLTAIANWRSYGTLEHDGVRYGQKAHSVRALIDLPHRLGGDPPRFALLIDPSETRDVAELHRHGWVLIDAAHETATPESYARFVRASEAELGIAKEGYVVSRCGWFSDRSACYLASGRPVVAQRTGWQHVLPEGEGLLGFDDAAEAADAVAAVRAEPARHGAAARRIAEEHLDARRVLPALLEAGLG